MSKVGLAAIAVAAIAGAYALGRYGSHQQPPAAPGRRVLYYVDPMHPDYKSPQPGTAPDCGMALEPVYDSGSAPGPGMTPAAAAMRGSVDIDAETQRLLGIRTTAAERGGAVHPLRVAGRVTPEDTLVYRLNPGVDGFVRETFNDSVGTLVEKDRKLATYYSPDFLAVASGYLAASERIPGSTAGDGNRTVAFPGAISKQGFSSLQGYADRLRNLGMSEAQIKRVADERVLPQSVDVVAPATGFILARNISPGQHFEHNMEFYRIADLSSVWIQAEVFQQDAEALRPGAVATVTYGGSSRKWAARVTSSLPEQDTLGGTVKLRLEAANPGFALRPGMLVDVELPVSMRAAVTVPADALIDAGTSSRVYVQRGDRAFEPREVQAGWRNGGRVEILRGLAPGERVVSAATFLVDSESRLKSPTPRPAGSTAPQSVQARVTTARASKTATSASVAPTEAVDPSCGMHVDASQSIASGNTARSGGATYYFCSRQCKEKFQSKIAATPSLRAGGGGD